MKRLIKYHSSYESDGAKFSACSTTFEVLPELVEDNAGIKELKALAKKHGLKIGRKAQTLITTEMAKNWPSSFVTHAINLTEKFVRETYMGKTEEHIVYIGFITLCESGPLKPVKEIDTSLTEEQAQEIINSQYYGVSDVGEHAVEDKLILVKSGWEYYNQMRLLGYNHKQFEEILNAEDYGFNDDTFRCGECGLFDSNDDGRHTHFRIVDGDILGVRCGCFDEHCKENFAEEYGDNPDHAIERDTALELQEEGKLKLLETFIGGMVDGRGGYFAGKPTREGTPEAVLKEYKEKYPKKTFLFTHDESGQFQTYFSIWEIKKTKSKSKRKAA